MPCGWDGVDLAARGKDRGMQLDKVLSDIKKKTERAKVATGKTFTILRASACCKSLI